MGHKALRTDKNSLYMWITNRKSTQSQILAFLISYARVRAIVRTHAHTTNPFVGHAHDRQIIRLTSSIELGHVLCFPRLNRGDLQVDLQLLRKVPNGRLVAVVKLRWGPPKTGPPSPHFNGKMGTQVPIVLV